MTGPEHYKAAEGYLADAAIGGSPVGDPIELTALAQVHATLAVADFLRTGGVS